MDDGCGRCSPGSCAAEISDTLLKREKHRNICSTRIDPKRSVSVQCRFSNHRDQRGRLERTSKKSEIRAKDSVEELPLVAIRLGRLAARLMADAADHESRSSSLDDEEAEGSSVLVALPGNWSH